MKTTVVPAQITTVEDKIAGSLTLPQIMLLVVPLILGAAIYAGIPPKMHLGSFKLTLIIIQYAFFGALALRFNGKIVADWLVVYLRFKSRPSRYIFTKNDLIYRETTNEKEKITREINEEKKSDIKNQTRPLTLLEERNIGKIFNNDSLTISFKPSKKGGMDVLLKQKKD